MLLSIVVPIYNERENLPLLHRNLIDALGRVGLDYEILLINDGSTDGSTEELNRLAADSPVTRVIHFRRNFGQTAAMMAGFRNSRGDIIITLDGDLQNDPGDIPLLLAKIDEGYDVVSGWRKDRKDAALSRNLPSALANRLISRISGIHLHDYGCTLKAYRREVVENIRLYGEMHRFIPIHAAWEGARVTEVPVSHHQRRFGQSKYGLGRVPRVILDLIVIRFLDRALDRPMQFFGRLGLKALAAAFLVGLWALWLKLFEGTSFIQTPLPLLVVLLTVSGMLCVLMGLLAEIQTRTYYESRGGTRYVIRDTVNFPSSAE